MGIRDLIRHLTHVGHREPAVLHKFAVMSRAIHDQNQRPIYVYRTSPVQPDDSGWVLTVGEADPSDVVPAHLHHVQDRWPELRAVFADPRDASRWAWNEAHREYRELSAPRPGA